MNETNVVANGRHGLEEADWSIPGVHTPVTLMIHSWLDACQALPIPREIVDRNIPYHFEERELKTTEAEGMHDMSPGRPPPTEILLPIKMDQSVTPYSCAEGEMTDCGKYTYWGEVVDNSSFDWWYTLRVLRDCSDLVSAGWSPSGRVGERIILNLISIVERGLSFLVEGSDLMRGIRKGRLVACSCLAESLIAMKTLASREEIPQSALRPLATALCQAISAAETPITSDVNCGSDVVQEEDIILEKEILTQQTFFASNSAELLWVLLARENTACPVTDVLLDAVNIDLHVVITDDNRAEVNRCAKISRVAIRTLSAALWGGPPSVAGLPQLRFLTSPLIDLFGSVASSFFKGQNHDLNSKFNIAGHETSVVLLDKHVPSLDGDNGTVLDVIFEIVLAMQRLFQNEMVSKGFQHSIPSALHVLMYIIFRSPNQSNLCPTEWESVVRSIDVGVSPWLLRRDGSLPVANEIRAEAMALFSQITSFLLSASNTIGFHPIVDDDSREYLHLFCLRKIAPLLRMEHTIAKPTSYPVTFGDDATNLAIAVIKSWSAIRYLPFKEGDWARRASHVLAEAFLIPNSQSIDDCPYIGGYLHHPLVRLEALKSLFTDESYATGRDSSSISNSESAVSMKSRIIPSAISIFTRELVFLTILNNYLILPTLITFYSHNEFARITLGICKLNHIASIGRSTVLKAYP